MFQKAFKIFFDVFQNLNIMIMYIIICSFVVLDYFFNFHYLHGVDSFHYFFKVKGYVGFDAFTMINKFIYSVFGGISLPLFWSIMLCLSLFYVFFIISKNNFSSLMFTILLWKFPLFYQKIFGWLDTHLLVIICVILIFLTYIQYSDNIKNEFLLSINFFVLVLVLLSWNGHIFIIIFYFYSLFISISERNKSFVVAFLFFIGCVIFAFSSSLIKTYLGLMNSGITELMSFAVEPSTVLLILAVYLLLFLKKDYKTILLYSYLVIPSFMMVRFVYLAIPVSFIIICWKLDKKYFKYFFVFGFLFLILNPRVESTQYYNEVQDNIFKSMYSLNGTVLIYDHERYFYEAENYDYISISSFCSFMSSPKKYIEKNNIKFVFWSTFDNNPNYLCNDDFMMGSVLLGRLYDYQLILCDSFKDKKYCLWKVV